MTRLGIQWYCWCFKESCKPGEGKVQKSQYLPGFHPFQVVVWDFFLNHQQYQRGQGIRHMVNILWFTGSYTSQVEIAGFIYIMRHWYQSNIMATILLISQQYCAHVDNCWFQYTLRSSQILSKFPKDKLVNNLQDERTISSWWFQPIWKILISQNGNLPQVRVKITNIWNHHPDLISYQPSTSSNIQNLQRVTAFSTNISDQLPIPVTVSNKVFKDDGLNEKARDILKTWYLELICISYVKWGYSIAMLVYHRVYHYIQRCFQK